MSAAQFMVVSAAGDHEIVFTGQGQDAFPFPATWLSKTELLYTGDGHLLHVDLATKTETPIPFTATITSIRPQYPRKVYDFDSTAARQVKGIFAPALSPDGKQIAFVALNQLYVMTIGRTPIALTNDSFYKQGPAWSPDGKTLAYVSDKNGIENVYLHDMASNDTAGDKQISPSSSAQIMPAWSPDAKLIAFQDQTGATLLIDVATGACKAACARHLLPGSSIFFVRTARRLRLPPSSHTPNVSARGPVPSSRWMSQQARLSSFPLRHLNRSPRGRKMDRSTRQMARRWLSLWMICSTRCLSMPMANPPAPRSSSTTRRRMHRPGQATHRRSSISTTAN